MGPINLIARKYNIPQDLEIYVMQECILPSEETTRNNMKMTLKHFNIIRQGYMQKKRKTFLTTMSFYYFFFSYKYLSYKKKIFETNENLNQ